MLRTVEVGSADDVRLADYTRLTDSGLRTHLETEHGLFIAEGTKVITRAVAAGYPVRSMLLGRGRLADLPALGEAASGAPARDVLPVVRWEASRPARRCTSSRTRSRSALPGTRCTGERSRRLAVCRSPGSAR